MTRTKVVWSLRSRVGRGRCSRQLRRRKVQVGKTPDGCSSGLPCDPVLLGKGRAARGNVLCLPALLSLPVTASSLLEANGAGFPHSWGGTTLPHTCIQFKSCSQCFLTSSISSKSRSCPSTVFFLIEASQGTPLFPCKKRESIQHKAVQSYMQVQTQTSAKDCQKEN